MRAIYKGVFRDGTGNPVSSGQVNVFLAGTSTAASIYTTETGTTAANYTTSGSDGTFTFYVDRFDYDTEQKFKLSLSKTGYTTSTWDNVEIDNVIIKTYTISDDKTVSTHIDAPKGVIYSVATGKTLTFTGQFTGTLDQHFAGAGSIAFSAGSIISPDWFISASTDAARATGFSNAMASLPNGGVVDVRKSYSLDSTTLAAMTKKAVNITYDNISIIGSGFPTLTVSGTAACGVFYADAKSDIRIHGIKFVGNNTYTSGVVYGSAFYYINTSATAATKNIFVENCEFVDFKGVHWIRVERDSAADFDIENVHISHNKFSGGSTVDASDETVGPSMISVSANDIVGGSSYLQDVWIQNNDIDASDVKYGIFFNTPGTATRINLRRGHITGNNVRNAGLTDSTTYGYNIALYSIMEDMDVSHNISTGGRSCNIYLLYQINPVVSSNIVEGQAVNDNVNLVRAGIGVADSTGAKIQGNTVRNCLKGIEIDTDPSSINTLMSTTLDARSSTVSNNTIFDCTVAGIDATVGGGETLVISGNPITCAAGDYGIYAYKSTLSSNMYLDIRHNFPVTAKVPIRVYVGSGKSYVRRVNIEGNEVYATGTESDSHGVYLSLSNVRFVSVRGNRAYGTRTTSTIGYVMSGLIEADIRGNLSHAFDKGFRTDNATGWFIGNMCTEYTTSIISAQAGIDMGSELPSIGSWPLGAKVEDMGPAHSGTEGWIITTAGTFGTLNGGGTTGGITSGEKTLTVNAATGLVIGQYITIAGVTGVFRVESISGTTITLNNAADATVVAAAVAFSTPAVYTFGVIS